MKCPKCGGNAELSNWGSIIDIDYADYHVECEKCGYHSMGSTDPLKAKEMFEKEMGMHYTNEQWIKQCTTEQLAEWIAHQTMIALLENQNNHSLRMTYPAYWVEWLKQQHTIKE